MRQCVFTATASAIALVAFCATPAVAQDRTLAEVFATGANFCPRGTLPAEGQILPIRDNTALFSLLGTRYGGDGRSTFALPDLRQTLTAAAPDARTVEVQYCIVTEGMFPTRR